MLISAWRGDEPSKSKAWQILADESRFLIASPLLRLETLPKARNHGSNEEVEFLEYAFSLISEWVTMDDLLVELAIELGTRHQLRTLTRFMPPRP